MTVAVTDLTLPRMYMEEDSFAADPFSHFAAARAQHPWLAQGTHGYVITGYAAIKELLAMDDRMKPPQEGFVEVMGAKDSIWGRFQLESLLALSGEEHTRIRSVVAPIFTPRNANRHRGVMREVVSRLLDEWATKPAFDFEDFAANFPIRVMCRLIGAPADAVPKLRSSLEAIGMSFSLVREMLPRFEAALETMEAFIVELVAARRAGLRLNAEPDLLDALLEAQDSGGLTAAEMTNLLIVIFVGGYDTSKNMLTLTMYRLLDRPDIYKRCAEDLAFCHKVIEESLQFQGTSTTGRLVDEDIVYRDILFPKGTLLFFPVGQSGRDPLAVDDPESFNPDRPVESRHMSFGRGAHLCLGQYIARAQMEEGLHLMTQRFRSPKIAGPVDWRPFPGAWGLTTLPITIDTSASEARQEAAALH